MISVLHKITEPLSCHPAYNHKLPDMCEICNYAPQATKLRGSPEKTLRRHVNFCMGQFSGQHTVAITKNVSRSRPPVWKKSIVLIWEHLFHVKFNNDPRSRLVNWLLSKHNITVVDCAGCATCPVSGF